MQQIQHSQLAPLPLDLPFRVVSKTIGTGAYACIKKAAPLHSTSPIFAVKFINKEYALKYGRIKEKQIALEITLHKHLNVPTTHQNIVVFHDSGEDRSWRWIAMELAEGGDLFDKIEADSGVSEDIAHVYFTQLINAVSYMHSKKVAHRDIKPENILLSGDGDLKLADFGMASLFEYQGRKKFSTSLAGSPPYIAPEVLQDSHNGQMKGVGYRADMADIWSCGVVLFVLLAGNTPWDRPVIGFDDFGEATEFSEYVNSNGRPEDELWDALPTEVLSLLRGMMNIDVPTRSTLEDIRRHPWFTRRNPHLSSEGRLADPMHLATSMFESLKISLDTTSENARFASQPSRRPRRQSATSTFPTKKQLAYAATQPVTPAEDMLFDWDTRERSDITYSQGDEARISHFTAPVSTQGPDWLADEPSMSQFAATPAVPLSRTQMARRFNQILPASNLTRFFSLWKLQLVAPLVVEALGRLAIPVPVSVAGPGSGIGSGSLLESWQSSYNVKVRTVDTRGCKLSGQIIMEQTSVGQGDATVLEVNFIKGSGDPLEWRRLFKKVAVLCKDAIVRPDEMQL